MSKDSVPRAISGVMRGSTIAVAARGIGLVTSLATGVVIARALGPDGKGTLAFLSALAALLVRMGSVGLDGSFAQFYLAQRRPLRECVGAVVWITLSAGLVAGVLAEAALFSFPHLVKAAPTALAGPFLAATPAFFVLFVSTFVFFALGREMFFGLFDIGFRVTLLAMSALVLFGLGGGLAAAVWVQIAVSILFAAVAAIAIGRAVQWQFPINRPLVRAMLAYGCRYYAYGLLRYALCYQGILMAGFLLTDTDTGLLSVAVMLGEVIILFASSVNLAFYPAVATASEPHKYTASIIVRVAGISALLAIALVAVARPAIGILYGVAFLPSIAAFVSMAPGYVLLGSEQVATSYFAAHGMPMWIVGILLAGIVFTVLLAVAVAPRFGLQGVAASIGCGQVFVAASIVLTFTRSR